MRQIRLAPPVLPSETRLRQEKAETLRFNRQLALENQQLARAQLFQQRQQQQELDNLSRQAIDNPQALQQLASISPARAGEILDYKTRVTEEIGKSAFAIKSAPLPNREAIYQQQLQRLEGLGYPVNNLPAEYDQKIVDPMLESAISLARGIQEQKPLKREIRSTEQGLFGVDPVTLEAEPIRAGGEVLRPPSEPKTVVQIGEGEKEEQKQIGKIRAARFQKYVESGDSAQRGLETLQTLEQAISNPDVAQGAFAGIRQDAKKVADLFGVEVKGLADEAVVAAIGNKLALQLRNPKGEDGGLTGATSDRDLKFLVAGVPNREKTREQNLALIEIAKRDKERTVRLKNEAVNYLEERGTMAGFESYKKDWLEANPLFEEGSQEKLQVKRLLETGPLRSISGGKPKAKIEFLGFEEE